MSKLVRCREVDLEAGDGTLLAYKKSWSCRHAKTLLLGGIAMCLLLLGLMAAMQYISAPTTKLLKTPAATSVMPPSRVMLLQGKHQRRVQTIHEMLGLKKGCSVREIVVAYRKEALACHPDKHADDPVALERFKLLSEAYVEFTNPKPRPNGQKQASMAAESYIAHALLGGVLNVPVERLLNDYTDVYFNAKIGAVNILNTYINSFTEIQRALVLLEQCGLAVLLDLRVPCWFRSNSAVAWLLQPHGRQVRDALHAANRHSVPFHWPR